MSETLTGLAAYCGKISGGLTKVEYAPVDIIDADSFEPITSGANLQKGIVFLNGTWLTAFLKSKNRLHEEPFRHDVQGGRFEQTVSGDIEGESDALHTELDSMRRRRFLIRITDKSGIVKLIGTPTNPLRFEWEYTSGEGAASGKKYAVRWYGDTPERAYFYNPTF